MTELPKIVSVDDHVIEPAHLFDTWLPEKNSAMFSSTLLICRIT